MRKIFHFDSFSEESQKKGVLKLLFQSGKKSINFLSTVHEPKLFGYLIGKKPKKWHLIIAIT